MPIKCRWIWMVGIRLGSWNPRVQICNTPGRPFFFLYEQLMSTRTNKARGMHHGLCQCPASLSDPILPRLPARRTKVLKRMFYKLGSSHVRNTYSDICCGLVVFSCWLKQINHKSISAMLRTPVVDQKLKATARYTDPSISIRIESGAACIAIPIQITCAVHYALHYAINEYRMTAILAWAMFKFC